jgi:hypothetical protein
MRGPPAALRLALGYGIPAEIEIVGSSMEPTLAKGVKVTVAALEAGAALVPGDLVVLETDDRAVLLLHRVLHVFREGQSQLVIHQGDARRSSFGVCPREFVIARVTAATGGASLPTLEHLSSLDRTRFLRRRLAGRGFALVRSVTSALGVRDLPLARQCGDLYRWVARRLTG